MRRAYLPLFACAALTGALACRNTPPRVSAGPAGPDSGVVGQSLEYFAEATDPDDDSVRLRFSWGDGSLSYWSLPGAGICVETLSHAWNEPGDYEVRAQALDEHNDTSAWSEPLLLTIDTTVAGGPPAVSAPVGPDTGTAGRAMAYAAAAIDPDGDSVALRFSWGDGDTSGWSGFVASGCSVAMDHAWAEPGDYQVRCQAVDIHDAVSEWSPALPVSIGSTANRAPTPGSVAGPDSGGTGTAMRYAAAATDPDDDAVSLRFSWGSGDTSSWSAFVPSGCSVAMDHAWSRPGEYPVCCQAVDVHDASSDWSPTLVVRIDAAANHPPVPSPPAGPDNGTVGASLAFAATAVDPESELVSVRFSWDDGDTSGWSGFVASGCSVTVDHAWENPGTYALRVQARDIHAESSSWSAAHWLTVDTAPPGDYPDHVVRVVYTGLSPVNMDCHPDGDYVYVGTETGDCVLVIRTSDDVVCDTAHTGSEPWFPCCLPDGIHYYVNNHASCSVSQVRVADNVVQASVPVDGNPCPLCCTPDGGRVYSACDEPADHVYVIRTSDNQVEAVVPVGSDPRGITCDPDGEYVYTADFRSYTVSVISTATNAVVSTIGVPGSPNRIKASPDGDFVYAMLLSTSQVAVISTVTRTVTGTIAVGGAPTECDFLPDGRYAYVANHSSGTVSVIRTQDHTVVATIAVGPGPIGVACLPDGSRVYVSCEDGNVYVIGY